MDKELSNMLLGFVTMKCLLCDETFMSKYNLRIHLRKEHTGDEATTFIEENV